MVERPIHQEFIEDSEFDSEAPYCKVPYLQPVPTVEEMQPEAGEPGFLPGNLIYLSPKKEELQETKTELQPPQPSVEAVLHEGIVQDVAATSTENTSDIRTQFRERLKAKVRQNPKFQDNITDKSDGGDQKNRDKIMVEKTSKKGESRTVTRGQLEDRFTYISKIYSKISPQMFWLAYSMVGEAETAEDIVHDVYFALAESEKSFDQMSRNYILRATSNKARDVLRRKKWTVPSTEQTELYFQTLQSREISTEEQIEIKDKADAILCKVNGLLTRRRDGNLTKMIFDEYVSGATIPEISKKFQVEKGMAKSKIHRLKTKVKKQMADYD